MKKLSEISNVKIDLEDLILTLYENYFSEHNFETWANNTYEKVINEGQNISEFDFYESNYSSVLNYGSIPMYFLWQELIYERLENSFIMTDKNMKKIKNFQGILKLSVLSPKYLKFQIEVDSSIFDIEKFNKLMNFYNYALDYKSDNVLTYEAVKPIETEYSKKYVYHITNKKALSKIKKVGLLPKQKDRYNKMFKEYNSKGIEYPGRIYCFDQDTSKNTIKTFISMKSRVDKSNNINRDYVLLRIDVESFNSRFVDPKCKMKFYTDPAYNIKEAMFTCEPIPTKYIEEINLEDL